MSTQDYYERLEIEKDNRNRIIKDIADKQYNWILSDDEIDWFFEIIELADKEMDNNGDD